MRTVSASRAKVLIATIAAGVVLGLLALGVVTGRGTQESAGTGPPSSPVSKSSKSPGSVPTAAGPTPPVIDDGAPQGR